MAADFLAVGHIVKDVIPLHLAPPGVGARGWRLGGSVAYATLQAHRLGLKPAAVTACSPDISPAEHLPYTQWHVLADERTTTFENTYRDGRRYQRLIDSAQKIGIGQIPRSWLATPIVRPT